MLDKETTAAAWLLVAAGSCHRHANAEASTSGPDAKDPAGVRWVWGRAVFARKREVIGLLAAVAALACPAGALADGSCSSR
jgi:hypothetical protein